MDNIKEIAIANTCKILSDELDNKEEGKWEKIFKCAGQRKYYEDNKGSLQPFWYNGTWQNNDMEYNPFSVLDRVFIELYSEGRLDELTRLISEIVSNISKWSVLHKQKELEKLNNNLNLLGYEVLYEHITEYGLDNEKCELKSLSIGAIDRVKDVAKLSSWLEKFFPNTSSAYTSAIDNYAQGNPGACIGECRVVLTGFYSYFNETKNWFNGVLKVTKDTISTNDYKKVNEIFKDSADGEYVRFKAIYKIYSMLSDLGTHRDEGVIEISTMSDALMCLRMTEDILICGMMNNLETKKQV